MAEVEEESGRKKSKRNFLKRKNEEQKAETVKQATKEAAKEALQEHHEETKSHWFKRFIAPVFSVLFKPASLVSGGVAGAVVSIAFTQLGAQDQIVFNDFGQIRATDDGLRIHGSMAHTPAAELANIYAVALREKMGISNAGYSNGPSPGAIRNAENLTISGNEYDFALSQANLAPYFDKEGISDLTYVLIETNNPECTFMPTSGQFKTLNSIIRFAKAQEELRREEKPFEMLRIAITADGTGSRQTALDIMETVLPNNNILDVRTFIGAPSIINAVKNGDPNDQGWKPQIGFFVEYPGRAQARLQHGLKTLYETETPLISISLNDYQDYFQTQPQNYSLLQPTIYKEIPWKYVNTNHWAAYFSEEDKIELPTMLCTYMNILARKPNSANNKIIAKNLAFRNDLIMKRIKPKDLDISDSTEIIAHGKPKTISILAQ